MTQSQQLRLLGETTERVAAQLERVRGGGSASAAPDETSLEGVLHPELKDFLQPKETHWPPPGAKTNGVIAIDWPSGDPKGFNPITENAGDLSDKLSTYVESLLVRYNGWTNPDRFYGDLARRVEVRDDFKEFTIYLRKGVKWHPVSGVDLSDPAMPGSTRSTCSRRTTSFSCSTCCCIRRCRTASPRAITQS